MKVGVNLSLREYIERGNANTDGLLAGHHPLMGLVTDYYDFFATKLWADGQPIPQVPMFLSTNAFLLWTGGLRMAMSGHEAAVYPLFRTGLESACYALIITLNPPLASIWADRDRDEGAHKASRKSFSSAVADAAKHLGANDPRLSDFITQLYQASIDCGAHPNVRSIMNFVEASPKTADEARFDQGSIYPGNSLQVGRALAAAIDYGQGIAFVLAHCLPTMTRGVADTLHELQQRRAELFA